MSDDAATIAGLRRLASDFVTARNWQRYHTPKDLAASIAIEAGELQELFLWKSDDQIAAEIPGDGLMPLIEEEVADVILLCLCLANTLDFDVSQAVSAKVRLNEAKYPIDTSDRVIGKHSRLRRSS